MSELLPLPVRLIDSKGEHAMKTIPIPERLHLLFRVLDLDEPRKIGANEIPVSTDNLTGRFAYSWHGDRGDPDTGNPESGTYDFSLGPEIDLGNGNWWIGEEWTAYKWLKELCDPLEAFCQYAVSVDLRFNIGGESANRHSIVTEDGDARVALTFLLDAIHACGYETTELPNTDAPT